MERTAAFLVHRRSRARTMRMVPGSHGVRRTCAACVLMAETAPIASAPMRAREAGSCCYMNDRSNTNMGTGIELTRELSSCC